MIHFQNEKTTLELIKILSNRTSGNTDFADKFIADLKLRGDVPGSPPVSMPLMVVFEGRFDFHLIIYNTRAYRGEHYGSIFVPDFMGGNVLNFYTLNRIMNDLSNSYGSAVFEVIRMYVHTLLETYNLPPDTITTEITDDCMKFQCTTKFPTTQANPFIFQTSLN